MDTTIVTLQLDNRSQQMFDELRQRYYPPALNQIPAHLTLFHQLPETESVVAGLTERARGEHVFPIEVTGVRSLGRGVAFECASPRLLALHRDLATGFVEWLTAQDRQRFQPHIVVQNKAAREEVAAALLVLRASPLPTDVRACGLDLWRYLGGPWLHLQTFPFAPGVSESDPRT